MTSYSRSLCTLLCTLHLVGLVSPTRAEDAADPLSCTLAEPTRTFGIRDLPLQPAEVASCLQAPLTPEANGLVHCRMFWQLPEQPSTEGRPAQRPHCSDYSFLTPSATNPFTWGDGEVCLVKQVTRAQAEAGALGWYYLSSAPTLCPNFGPGLLLPSRRPTAVEVHVQCGLAVSRVSHLDVASVAPSECAPPAVVDNSGVGQICDRELSLDLREPLVELGSQACATGVCVTTPLGEMKCVELDGITFCGSSTTRCSCRCAGVGDDPGPFCTCPDSYECKPLLSDFAGSEANRGSYCVPTDGLPFPQHR